MADEEPPALSAIARFTTRDALFYYALVLPAFVAEAVFTVSIASTPGDLISLNSSFGPLFADLAQILPVVFLGLSAYAVFSFRLSLLVTLLIASFLVAMSVANGMSILGVGLNLEATVILVVAATFLALAAFNYSRSVKLMGERLPEVNSAGSAGYNVVSIALESLVPFGAAVGLVLLVEAIVAAVGVQASHLPQPLSTLTSLYLQTRVGLVFTTLFVAGAAIWVIRQSIEPVILHFTLKASDAKKELLGEIEPTTKSVRKMIRYRPSGGIAWGAIAIAYSAGIAISLAYFLPHGQFLRDLSSVLSLRPPAPSNTELLLDNAFQNGIVKADILFAQSQDYIREIIRLVWG